MSDIKLACDVVEQVKTICDMKKLCKIYDGENK